MLLLLGLLIGKMSYVVYKRVMCCLFLDLELVYVGNFWTSQSLGEGAAEASKSQHSHSSGWEQGGPRREEASGARGEAISGGGRWFILTWFMLFNNCSPFDSAGHWNILKLNLLRVSHEELFGKMRLLSRCRTPRRTPKTLACCSWRRRRRRPSTSTSSFWLLVRMTTGNNLAS